MSRHNGRQELLPCPEKSVKFTYTAIRKAGKVVQWVRNYIGAQ